MLATDTPFRQFYDLQGRPLTGGKIYFGQPGQNPVTNPITVYWDAAGTQPAAQPVQTSSGFPVRAGAPSAIYAGQDYSILVQDSYGQQVLYASSSASFTNDQTLQDQINLLSSELSPLMGGISIVTGDGINDNTAAVQAANSAGRPILFVGASVINSPVTITVPIIDTVGQLFTPSSQVTIDNGMPVRPEWWGPIASLGGLAAGVIRYAVNALPASGGTVLLRNAAYRSGYETATATMFNNRGGTPGFDYMVKQHVKILGEKLGEYNGALTQMQNGTIVQGTFYISSECTGLHIDLVSCDVGLNVVNALYAGDLNRDGLCVLQCNKTAPAYGTDVHIGRVSGLGCGTGSLAHAVLFEAVSGSLQYAEARNAWHGVVFKTKEFTVGKVVGKYNFSEDCIIKSDSYAVLSSLTIDSIVSTGLVAKPTDGSYGLLIQAATASGGEVSIGKLVVDNRNFAYRLQALTGMILADVQIGQVIARSCTYGYDLIGDVRRSQVAIMKLNACGQSALTCYPDVVEHSHYIGSLSVVSAVKVFDLQSTLGGGFRVGDLYIESITGIVFNYGAGGSSLVLIEGAFCSRGTIAAYFSGLPALQNSWVNYGTPQDIFTFDLRGGQVVMSGLIKSGTTAVICTLPPEWRPAKNLRFSVLASNGSTIKAIELLITASTGVVSIGDLAAATGTNSYLNLRGVAFQIPF